MKYAFRFGGIVDPERHGETFHLFIVLGRSVGPHQDLVTQNQAGMAYERLRNSGLTQALTDLLADLGDLVQKEIQLAKAEVTDKIFPLIADFHRWGAWSPYEKLDPAMKRTFSGAANGKGAVYEWDSDGKAGKGRMTAILMTQRVWDSPNAPAVYLDFWTSAYQAIDD